MVPKPGLGDLAENPSTGENNESVNPTIGENAEESSTGENCENVDLSTGENINLSIGEESATEESNGQPITEGEVNEAGVTEADMTQDVTSDSQGPHDSYQDQ